MPLHRLFPMLTALLTSLALPATAEDVSVVQYGDLTITAPYILETPPGAKSAAGYVTIRNTGDSDEVLISAASPIADVQIHKSETDAAGVTRMVHQEAGIPLAAGETVTLAPGGLHLMMMGLKEQPSAEAPPLIMLVFRDAGEVMLNFAVLPRGQAPTGGHDGTGH